MSDGSSLRALMGAGQPAPAAQPAPTAPAAPGDSLKSLLAEPEPGQTAEGQVTNDVGNTVIVPKEGESFQDTQRRAIARSQGLTPEARQAEINKETSTIPAKTAETLGAAAGIGAGTATVGAGMEALPAVVPATINGAKAVTAWAAKNPVHAYIVYQLLKELLPGFRKATGIIKGAPE